MCFFPIASSASAVDSSFSSSKRSRNRSHLQLAFRCPGHLTSVMTAKGGKLIKSHISLISDAVQWCNYWLCALPFINAWKLRLGRQRTHHELRMVETHTLVKYPAVEEEVSFTRKIASLYSLTSRAKTHRPLLFNMTFNFEGVMSILIFCSCTMSIIPLDND
jgi:hypothetical protein